MKRPGQKSIHIYVPARLHKQICQNAEKRNMTITRFVLQAILEKLMREWQYQ